MQRVQNAAARLVLGKCKRDHVTPMLKELHWLPVKARCIYKLLVLAYRHFDGSLAPSLDKNLETRIPTRVLRSSNERLLVVPSYELKSAGKRSFSVAAATHWNKLPKSQSPQTVTKRYMHAQRSSDFINFVYDSFV